MNTNNNLQDEYMDRLRRTFLDFSHVQYGSTIYVTFKMLKEDWEQIRKQGQLGHLYGTDLSNFLSRQGILNQYCVPVVDDRKRCKAGVKTISVEYRLNQPNYY